MKLAALISSCALMFPSTVAAQTMKTAVFKQMVDVGTKNNAARIYECGRQSDRGAASQSSRLVERLAKMATARNEAVTAKQLGCTLMSTSKATSWAGYEPRSAGIQTPNAVWVAGDFAMLDPYATGYNFLGIMRVPANVLKGTASATHGVTARVNEAVDRDFFKRLQSRSIAGDLEEGGYLVCPTAKALDASFDKAMSIARGFVDNTLMSALRANSCRVGKTKLTSIKAYRFVDSPDVQYFATKGIEGGKPVTAMVWFY